MTQRRCAIYTRKSTEEGLEQDFNSLDAQRAACEAYIKSQKGEGWTVCKTRYDDGGFSGATLARPGLQALLADVEHGRIKVIVVYKVDRLTRSLTDFAKLVECLDGQGVSFVSVTQQFNTTSSMGRLTLNVLLSFAQFEREVTAERIRDKIAQSKKKGLWMGGVVPLGYDVEERKLIINESEAKTVRALFQLYLELGSVSLVQEQADRLDLRTKARQPNNGKRIGNMPFTRGHLYKLLAGPIYIGQITHKGERYEGEHDGIIDRETWKGVQQQLEHNAARRHHKTNAATQSLLTGKLFDGDGKALTPTYAAKAGRRYRYYISRCLKGRKVDKEKGWRLPAPPIEECIVKALCDLLQDHARLIHHMGPKAMTAGRTGQLLERASLLRDHLLDEATPNRLLLIREIIDRVWIEEERLSLSIAADQLCRLLEVDPRGVITPLVLEVPVRLQRRGIGKKLVLGLEPDTYPNPALVKAIAEAHLWFEEIKSGRTASIGELARRASIHPVDASRQLTLAFLAPDIVEAILEGRQPSHLTAKRLKRFRAPLSWKEQRQRLGFTVHAPQNS